MASNIDEALHEAILLGKKKYDGQRAHFWASSMRQCPRKQVLERAGVAPLKVTEIWSEFKMATGTVLGRWIAQSLESVGFLDKEWTERRVEYRCYSGRLDGLTHRLDCGDAIVEIKTADDRAIKREMSEHYLWQGMFYCLAFNIPNLLLFQIGKNQGLSKHRLYHLTPEWKEALEAEISKMEALWQAYTEKGVIPEHEHHFGWEEKMCSYLENKEEKCSKAEIS